MDFEPNNFEENSEKIEPTDGVVENITESEEENEKGKGKIKVSTAILIIAVSVLVTICLTVIGTVFVIDRIGGNTLGLSRENWERLKWGFSTVENMYYKDAEEDKLVDGALIGLSYALDEYSMYMPAEEVDDFMSLVNAEDYCGVGMHIYSDVENNCVTVLSTLPESPAEKAGLKENDIIKAVDGEEVGSDVNKASSMLMGEKGTEVEVTVIRASNGETEKIKIKRDEIKQDVISSKMLRKNIGYIKLTSFGSETYEHFNNEFEKLEKQGMKKLIIDLRDNPGGYLNSATAIAEIFLEKDDLIISTKDYSGHVTEYRAASDGVDMEVVIICNEESASASEILTVALKDNGKATVVGTKTYGKGVTQAMVPYDDGSMFKITDTRYYTPNEVCIDKKGVEPDIKVEDDAETDKDEQLEKALEVLL